MSSKSHGKVKSTEQAENILFLLFFYLLRSLQMIRSSQGHNKVKLSIKTGDNSLFLLLLLLRKNLGLTPL